MTRLSQEEVLAWARWIDSQSVNAQPLRDVSDFGWYGVAYEPGPLSRFQANLQNRDSRILIGFGDFVFLVRGWLWELVK